MFRRACSASCFLFFFSSFLLSGILFGEEKDSSKFRTGTASRHYLTRPLRSMKIIPSRKKKEEMEMEEPRLPRNRISGRGLKHDIAVQTELPIEITMPLPDQNFDGIKNVDGFLPPDTNGDVGPNHYVQWVNASFAIFDKSGNILFGPADGDTLWQDAAVDDPCRTSNDGDPIVQYDHLADRWLLSQFALPNYPQGPFYQCIALSTTGNPTGTYHLYTFEVSPTKLNDYPHFGVWPDGYYMSVNQFDSANGLSFAGTGFYVFDRVKILAGDPSATFQLFEVPDFGGLLPSDLDGPAPPPGSPNYFATFDDDAFSINPDSVMIWKYHVDWTTPANSTLTGPIVINAAALDSDICIASREACIPQKNTTRKLEAISDRLMYRLQYRNFGTHESLILSNTVDADAGRAGIRWYEVRDPGGAPFIYQQSTFAPTDGNHRWMGSVAMDKDGNLAAGYSVSGTNEFPSIRYTGRRGIDPLNTLPQGEVTIQSGGGSQTSFSNRWGDYSMLAVDSTNDCTFWYTQEYYQATSSSSWKTRIASFRFPGCGAPPEGEIQFSNPSFTVNENATQANITITRNFGSTDAVSVQCSTTPGSATADTDYATTLQTLNFQAGDTTPQVCSIPILNDAQGEEPETVNVSLTNVVGGAIAGSPSTAVLTILDDDALFFENFDDLDISDWIPDGGNWVASSSDLVGTVVKKGKIISPFLPGCSGNCTFEVDLSIMTPDTRLTIFAWNESKKKRVEIALDDKKNKIYLKNKSNGITDKGKEDLIITSGTTIRVKTTFNNGQFQVFINGSATPILTVTSTLTPSGGIGFGAKARNGVPGTVKIRRILVY